MLFPQGILRNYRGSEPPFGGGNLCSSFDTGKIRSETAHDAGRFMCGFFVYFFWKNTLTGVKKWDIMLKCIIMTLYTQIAKMTKFSLCILLKI